MNCFYHSQKEGQYVCSKCGRTICFDCMDKHNDKVICKFCLNEVSNDNHSTSGFSTFCFSFFPGAGQMYLGLMNRGISIMALFFGFIFLITIFENVLFAFGIVIIVFYSFFDTFQLAKRIRCGEIIDNNNTLDSIMAKINQKHIAIGLIILGSMIMLNDVIKKLRFLNWILYDRIRNFIFPILLIIIGVVMIMRIKQNSEEIITETKKIDLNKNE